MNHKLKGLYDKKRQAYAEWKEVMDAAKAEDDRDLTAEENETVDRCESVIDDCNEKIETEKAAEERQRKLEATGQELDAVARPYEGQLQQPQAGTTEQRGLVETLRDMTARGSSRTEALTEYLKQDSDRATAAHKAMEQYLLSGRISPQLQEQAALRLDDDSAGGFLRATEQFVARLIQELDRMVWVRQYATVLPLTGAESMGVPTLDTDISDTNWTTELDIGNEDTSMAFGKRRLTPHPLAKYIKVSKDLLRSSAIGVEALVRSRMGYKFGTVQESAFLTGSGAQQPLGLFTASDNGISTSQDVSTDNTTTEITADGLINCKYSLEGQYLTGTSLRWVFHRDAIKMIRKLKDGDGQYLWVPGLKGDSTDTILNVPVSVSEFAPNTFSTGEYVGLIGDLSYYWIADAMSVEIQRLVELGAATNQDYFIGRAKLDGMPVLENAFARVTLA